MEATRALAFERVEKLGGPHQDTLNIPHELRLGDSLLVTLLGFGVDMSLTVLRLILAGTFERYPNLNLGAFHLGGVYPILKGRIDLSADVYPETGVNLT